MLFFWVKALHVISITLWMGALMVLGSMLGLAQGASTPEQKRLGSVARRLYLGLATPAMSLVLITGVSMISIEGMAYFKTAGWLHTKLLFVFALLGVDHVLMRKTKRLTRDSGGGAFVPTKLLVIAALLFIAAVIFAVVKPSFSS